VTGKHYITSLKPSKGNIQHTVDRDTSYTGR